MILLDKHEYLCLINNCMSPKKINLKKVPSNQGECDVCPQSIDLEKKTIKLTYNKLLENKNLLDWTINHLAVGFSPARVAAALNVNVSTFGNWIQRPILKTLISRRKLEVAMPAMLKVMDSQPVTWLERLFEEFRAPKKEAEASLNIQFIGWRTQEYREDKRDKLLEGPDPYSDALDAECLPVEDEAHHG